MASVIKQPNRSELIEKISRGDHVYGEIRSLITTIVGNHTLTSSGQLIHFEKCVICGSMDMFDKPWGTTNVGRCEENLRKSIQSFYQEFTGTGGYRA